MKYNKIYLLLFLLFITSILGLKIKESFNNHQLVKTFREGCIRGFYCPENTDYRINCPSGYICPDGIERVKCKNGSYCPGNPKFDGVDLEGNETPTRSYIEQICPKGFYCPPKNNLNGTQAIRCDAGKLCCYRGETDKEILAGSCKTNSDMQQLASEKKLYPGSKGWRSRTSQHECPPGYFCPLLDGDPTKSSGEVIACQAGMYCPAGSTSEQPCPAGFYCPVSTDTNIPSGEKIPCSAGDYCPEQTTNLTKRLCRVGHKCIKVGDLYGTREIKCDNKVNIETNEGGKYQNEEGKVDCKVCPNEIAANENSTRCLGCPRGNYCEDLNSLPKKCQPGSYVHKTYTCNDENSCVGGTRNLIENNEAQYPTQCYLCPKGQYQSRKGSIKCKLCPKGTYQDEIGQTKCKPCNKGEYQDRRGGTKCKKCEKGYYCSICNTIEDKNACNIQECHWDESTQLCSQPAEDGSLRNPRDELSDNLKDALRQKTITKASYDRIKTADAKNKIN